MPVHTCPTPRISFAEVMVMERSALKGRQVALCTLLIGAAAFLLASHDTVALAVREGLLLCVQNVIPSLFPLFVTVSLAIGCGLGELLPPTAAVLLLGLAGGYPVGAKTVAELVRSGAVEQQDAQKMLLYCNNAGPAFILGIAGYEVFQSARVGWALYGIHALSALLLFLLLPRGKAVRHVSKPTPPFAVVFVEAVRSGVAAMLNICGFVVLFLVALRLLTVYAGISHPLLLGTVELTNGILSLPNNAGGFVMAASLLGWGSFSVHCQTAAVLEGSGLKLFPYLLAKLAQSGLSAVLAFAVRGWLFA